jgi:hypothetical protein
MRFRNSNGARGILVSLVAIPAAIALVIVGLSGGVNAAHEGSDRGPGAAKAISNELVRIAPEKVKGAYTDPATGQKGRLVAKFVPTEFVDDAGALAVEGTLSGVFAGKLPKGQQRHFSVPVTMPIAGADAPGEASASAFQSAGFVQAQQQACDILHLDLGPLDLDLLGLQIHLDPVVLDIVAQPGAGNLLGNLLCAVAGLLDGGGGGLGGLLDGLLDALNGLLGGLLDLDALLEQLGGVLGGATVSETV